MVEGVMLIASRRLTDSLCLTLTPPSPRGREGIGKQLRTYCTLVPRALSLGKRRRCRRHLSVAQCQAPLFEPSGIDRRQISHPQYPVALDRFTDQPSQCRCGRDVVGHT
jgi:hypothetical protein